LTAVQTAVLRPTIQARLGGLNVGLMAIKPDEADPEAVLGIGNPETRQPETHRVRPGDRFEVAGRRFEVTGISPGNRGSVELAVRWTEPA
jgi:Family of unknown function (DUF6406)